MTTRARAIRSVLKLQMNTNYKETTMNNNTELFIKTIDSLAMCQGCYSRLSQQIHDAIDNDSNIIDRLDNELPKFYNSLDVVMYLEQ